MNCTWIIEELEHRPGLPGAAGQQGHHGHTGRPSWSCLAATARKSSQVEQDIAAAMGFDQRGAGVRADLLPQDGLSWWSAPFSRHRAVRQQVQPTTCAFCKTSRRWRSPSRTARSVPPPCPTSAIPCAASASPSLAAMSCVDTLNTAITAATQWFERTLDDSANKRIAVSGGVPRHRRHPEHHDERMRRAGGIRKGHPCPRDERAALHGHGKHHDGRGQAAAATARSCTRSCACIQPGRGARGQGGGRQERPHRPHLRSDPAFMVTREEDRGHSGPGATSPAGARSRWRNSSGTSSDRCWRQTAELLGEKQELSV